MQTVVLAAGRGTRMGPLTDRRPKPLLPVGDRSLLAHVLDRAAGAGATTFTLVVGYRGDAIRSTIGNSHAGVPVEYAEQPSQEGTADALAAAAEHLSDEHFAVMNGDVLIDEPSLRAVLEPRPAIAAATVEDPSDYGVLTVENDRVTGVIEKPASPPTDLVNAGAYVFPPAAREWVDVPVSERGERELTDVLERACRETVVTPIETRQWLDVGRPWDLLTATEQVLESCTRDIEGTVHPSAEITGAVRVAPDATVRAGTVIDGPAIIRNGATVGPNAFVRGVSVIGPGATVGQSVEIKNSVIMANTGVNHLSYVGDSLLGRDGNLGAGTIVANLRHDDEPVRLTVKGERRSTGRRKFGIVTGDDVKTGIDTSINAGVTLGTGARTSPGETVLRDRTS